MTRQNIKIMVGLQLQILRVATFSPHLPDNLLWQFWFPRLSLTVDFHQPVDLPTLPHRIHGTGIYTYMDGWFFIVNVGIYSIHGSYGCTKTICSWILNSSWRTWVGAVAFLEVFRGCAYQGPSWWKMAVGCWQNSPVLGRTGKDLTDEPEGCKDVKV